MAIWPYGNKGGQYGYFWKQQYKCSNLTQELSRLDLPARNESKNGLMAYFPLYMQKMVATPQKCSNAHEIVFGWLLRYRGSHMHLNRSQEAFWCLLGHPSKECSVQIDTFGKECINQVNLHWCLNQLIWFDWLQAQVLFICFFWKLLLSFG